MANDLQGESSPYLQQHANNPVNWFPWGDKALEKAKAENKLIIVSIGYSTCHWCHVMERESFENTAIAETMNKLFVSVKVDREERPDIDQVYMIAVQLMTNSGGWPLNCICLPDGRPIYGGTYFKPQDWQNILLQIAQMWEEQPELAIEYAERLTQGIEQAEKLPIQPIPTQYRFQDVLDIVTPWKERFDLKNGGYHGAPKFPLPNNWLFFLRYGHLAKDELATAQVHRTLRSMSSGGIYDHIGGGFSRYSVDPFWHVPHFEKMLYDNAQLISLYSEAFQQRRDSHYRQVIEETIEWAERELLAPNGGFYSALDADSEGVEGKFYVFDDHEFSILKEDAELARHYFHITPDGNWSEEQTNVPRINLDEDHLIQQAGFSKKEWEDYLRELKSKLLAYREQRVRPSLDNKQLTAWNALMIKGLVDAFRALEHNDYLHRAQQVANFLDEQCMYDGRLLHQPADHNRHISGFLDDYAFCIEAYLALYEATFDEHWCLKAKSLADQAIELFYDEQECLFHYSSHDSEVVVARKSEVMDNVIPSSSSVMVRQLHRLGLLYNNQPYAEIAEQLFANVFPQIKTYGSAYSNWAIHLLEMHYGIWEIVLSGEKNKEWRREVNRQYIPNKITLGGTKTIIPLLEHKVGLESKAYLCKDNTCSLPLDSTAELFNLINIEQGKNPKN